MNADIADGSLLWKVTLTLGTIKHIVKLGRRSDDLLSLVSDTGQLFKGIRISYQLVLSERKSNEAQTEPANLKSVNKIIPDSQHYVPYGVFSCRSRRSWRPFHTGGVPFG